MPSITLHSVTVDYGRVRALNDLTVTIPSGEYVVILGPSGAGKTTLLKVIAGLVRPKKGTILVDGQDITDLPPEERRAAYLPQDYALFPKMTVWENVMFSPKMQQMDPEKARELVREVLDLVNLSDRPDAFPHELSGGMKQRVALARAIATSYSILLLDEPLRALDARLRLVLRDELRKMATDLHLTVLHVTHDQEEAMSIADKIIVLRNGNIEQVGTQEEIYLTPKTQFVAEFVGETNTWFGIVKRKNKLEHFPSGLKRLAVQENGAWYRYDVHDELGNIFQSLTQESRFKVGQKVSLMIKYEALRLLKEKESEEQLNQVGADDSLQAVNSEMKPKPNRLKGIVVNSYYLGKWTHVTVRVKSLSSNVDHEVTWTSKLPSITARHFPIGEPVTVEIDPQLVFMFPIEDQNDKEDGTAAKD